MATFKELALTYAQRISSSQNPTQEVKKIRVEIENLVYASSQKKISTDDQIDILLQVQVAIKVIVEKREFKGPTLINMTDNSGTLDIIDSIIKDIKKVKP